MFSFEKGRKKKRKNKSTVRVFRRIARKNESKGAYIFYGSLYPSILNCGYRKDRIISDKKAKHLSIYINPYLRNSTVSAEMKERGNSIEFLKHKGDMAKLVDATDLIGLSLSMETY